MAKLAEIKTKQTDLSVEDFINGLKDETQRMDSLSILEMMRKASGEEPRMWGNSMIGFGKLRYKSPKTGREVDWFKIGFSPRKANISLHLVLNLKEKSARLEKLGKHKTGVGCLYINKLKDIDEKILEELIESALKEKLD
ncbi:MAG: DUF1801 domain-containing protein [Saprospiraceae bacterium]|nr:DUF1801 domain-containing protein [Saprospiraceae bacterium]